MRATREAYVSQYRNITVLQYRNITVSQYHTKRNEATSQVNNVAKPCWGEREGREGVGSEVATSNEVVCDIYASCGSSDPNREKEPAARVRG